MPTMRLTPDAGGASTLGWTTNASDNVTAIASDDGTTAFGSSYVQSTGNNSMTGIGFSNPSVAEGDIASITSVQWSAVGRCPARGSSGTDVVITYNTPSGFAETINFFNNRNYEVEAGTARTAKPDTSAWSYSDLEGLKLNVSHASGEPTMRMAVLYIDVVYVAAAVTDNAVFFGTNF